MAETRVPADERGYLACDAPPEGATVTTDAEVDGWAVSPVGIRRVGVWIAGREVGEATYGLERPDVATAFPERPGANHSGFRYRLRAEDLPAESGPVELAVVVEDDRGRQSWIRRRVEAVGIAAPPAVELVCEAPAQGAAVTRGAEVVGWAYSPTGIRLIEVELDGRSVGRAELGLERPDVAADHPEWNDAGRTGFRLLLERKLPPPYPRPVELAVVAEDGSGARTEVRRTVEAVAPPVPELVCEAPAEGAPVTRGAEIAGWVYSPAGITSIDVELDGRPVGRAELGLERPDVAADHPEWEGGGESGFRLVLGLEAPPPYPRPVELAVVAEDNDGNRTEIRRVVEAVAPPPPPIAGSLDIPKWSDEGDPLRRIGWPTPLVVHGWAVDPAGIERIDVLLDGRVVGQAEHGFPREDVELQHWEYRRLDLAARSGWWAVIPTTEIPTKWYALSAVVHGRSGDLELGPLNVRLRAEDLRADPARRRRIGALLRCPLCRATLDERDGGLVCAGCGRATRTNQFGSILADEIYADLDWREAGATNHGYPDEAREIVLALQDGLVLDIGAGLREGLPHLVQLDALAYPTTDVVANAEALPFADDSFDGVIACNLLEHVPTPANVIREIRRVCKRGGRIYVDWTAVHPYHGFPHHYSNATVTGLDGMMRELGGADGVAIAHPPHQTVYMILDAWLSMLDDPELRRVASEMTVREVVDLFARNPVTPNEHMFAPLTAIAPEHRRLIPPKVAFAGVRAR